MYKKKLELKPLNLSLTMSNNTNNIMFDNKLNKYDSKKKKNKK